jgi:hypothetical protein
VRKVPVAIIVLLLVATACGGGKKESALTGTSGSSATPGAGASAAPGKSAAPAKSGGSKSSTGGAATGKAAGQTGNGKPVVGAGGISPPKDGKYVYRLDGEATNPFTPASPPQKFSNETLTKTVSHSGNVITTEQSSSVSAGRSTQKVRWESNRILLLYIKAETPQGEYTCTFDPPLLITKFPLRAETIPTQNFKGQGNACSGKLDITVERQESAKDATGRSWSAWKVHVQTEGNSAQFTQKSDDTRWVVPVLGLVEVHTQGTTDLSIKGAGGTQNSHGSQQTALKSYPK